MATISDTLLEKFDTPGLDWIGFSNEAVKALYGLCEVPDTILTDILNKLLRKTFPPSGGDLLDNVDNCTPTVNVSIKSVHIYNLKQDISYRPFIPYLQYFLG